MQNTMVIVKFNPQVDSESAKAPQSIAERTQVLADSYGAIGVDADEKIYDLGEEFSDAAAAQTGIIYQFKTPEAAESFYEVLQAEPSLKSSGGNEIPLIYAEVLQKIGVVLSADADELMKAPVRDTFKYHEVAQQFALINAGTLSGTAYDAWRIGQFNTRAQARKFKVEIDKINEEMPFNTRTLVL